MCQKQRRNISLSAASPFQPASNLMRRDPASIVQLPQHRNKPWSTRVAFGESAARRVRSTLRNAQRLPHLTRLDAPTAASSAEVQTAKSSSALPAARAAFNQRGFGPIPDHAWPSASRYFATDTELVDLVDFSILGLAAFAETPFLATGAEFVPAPPTASDSRD